MSDIVADARRWLDARNGRVSSHSENCHHWHAECLVDRLVAEVERHRMTEEERASAEWWVNAEEACGYDMPLRNYLDRTAPKEE